MFYFFAQVPLNFIQFYRSRNRFLAQTIIILGLSRHFKVIIASLAHNSISQSILALHHSTGIYREIKPFAGVYDKVSILFFNELDLK